MDKLKKYLEFIKNQSDELICKNQAIVVILSKEGKIVFCNETFLNITGYSQEEIKDKDYFEMFIDPAENVKDVFNNIISGENQEIHINYIYTKTREKRLILWNNFAIKDETKNIIGTLSFGQDITVREEYNEDIKKINKTILEFTTDYEKNIELLVKLYKEISKADCVFYNKLDGNTIKTQYRYGVSENFPWEFEAEGTLCYKLLTSGKLEMETKADFENKLINEFGLKKYYGNIIWSQDKKIGTLCCFYKDENSYIKKGRLGIIARLLNWQEENKRLTENILNEKNRYSELFNRVPYLIYQLQLKPEKKILYVNKAIFQFTGANVDEFLNKNLDILEKFVHPEDKEKYFKFINSDEISLETLKLRLIKKDLNLIYVECIIVPVYDEKKQISSLQFLIRDITGEEKQAEATNDYIKSITTISNINIIFNKYRDEELYKQLSEFLKEIMSAEYVLLGDVDKDKNIVVKYMSKNVYGKCKLNDVIDKKLYKTFSATWAKAIMEKKIFVLDKPAKVPDGHIEIKNAISMPLKIKDEVVGIIVLGNKEGGWTEKDENLLEKISNHISDRLYYLSENKRLIELEKKMLEEQLQSQKIEALGNLAAGIAHDFNNFLLGISANISFLKERIKEKEFLEILKDAEYYADSAAKLARQFMSFSKTGTVIKEDTNSKEFLEQNFSFILRASKCKTEIEIQPDLKDFSIDKTQISQALANIIINSLHAMEENPQALLKIKAENYENPKDGINLKKGSYIKITISDNGKGISKENLKRVFEPFFTTKEKGHGLGLYMAWSIIEKHNGHIEIESEENVGTKVTIFIPALNYKVKAQKGEEKKNYIPEKKLKILIVDDEEVILNSLKRLISAIGMEVFTAKTSGEAFEISDKNPIDIAFIDLTLKGDISGKEINFKLKEKHPLLYTVASSGYSAEEIISDYKKYKFDAILPKPYKMEDLRKIFDEFYKRDN